MDKDYPETQVGIELCVKYREFLIITSKYLKIVLILDSAHDTGAIEQDAAVHNSTSHAIRVIIGERWAIVIRVLRKLHQFDRAEYLQ
jgi:hypothetical protein